MIAKSHRWQKTAVAAAAIALLGLTTTGALALSLGRITVQSALGEPLRAEIDVPDINAEEASSLKAGVASPAAFAAAGLEYNAAMASLQATLQRRADGRAYIRLSSDRPVNDPFVDMIIEASWSSGRILRDYTMLFDPPVLRSQAPVATTLPQTSTPAVTPRAGRATTPTAPAPSEPARSTPAQRPVAASQPKPAVVASPSDDARRVVVKSGDTASKIAANAKPAGVSLDQMLVALLRTNPDAFVNSNINRIRAGAVVDLPSAEQAQALSAAEATQTVVAQSKDFNEFRRNLAGNAPIAAVAAPARKSSGAIDTKVEDKKATVATPDKLTLSKGSVQSKTEDTKIAKERAEKEAAARAAEISKNISDLKKLGGASAAAPAAAAAPASQAKPAATPSVPAVAVAMPPPVAPVVAASAPASQPPSAPVAPTPVASAPVPAPSAAVSAAAVASAPASVPASAPAKPKPVVPVPPPVEETSLLDELLGNPVLPFAAGGLIALLGGFAFWRNRQRKNSQSHMDSSFLESRLQPDSFFGASGGQRVDTNNENSATGSSMVYSASQLDAADDVDPVAEADVYLAYGRDLQAEEILREAVRTNPGRLAIHTKLLEIFAKRRDAKNFEATATHAFQLTGNNSPDWTRICEMGMGFDPGNPLYQPGGAPTGEGNSILPMAAASASTFGNSTIPQPVRADAGESVSGVDLDLDLDFSLDEEPAPAVTELSKNDFSQAKVEQTIKMPAAPGSDAHAPMDMDMSMDFDLPLEEPVAAPAAEPQPMYEAPGALPEISLSMDLDEPAVDHHPAPEFNATAPAPVAAAPVAEAKDSGMLEFDLGSLSLDLDGPASEQPTASDNLTEDPLETKLALADEFVSIGDEDGARALIEEVIAEATGDMRAKAQRALANLS
nr:FimV/HubP family polar landmark protein [uncultured Rhodoferax sp.]